MTVHKEITWNHTIVYKGGGGEVGMLIHSKKAYNISIVYTTAKVVCKINIEDN